MSVTLKQHIAYSKSPALFMSERWLNFDTFYTKTYKNLTPFNYQLDFIKQVHEKNTLFVVKSRQMHLSSMMALYIAWYVLFNDEKTVAIVSESLKSGKDILFQVKAILQNYSVDDEKDGFVNNTYFHWEDDFTTNNQTTLQLRNGCRIRVSAPGINACRGESYDFAFVDEAAFTSNFLEFYSALGPCLLAKKGSKLIIGSTPKDNSDFNKLISNALSSNVMPLHWSLHPFYNSGMVKNGPDSEYTYSSPWFEEMCSRFNFNKESIEQELECKINFKEQNNKSQTISLRIDYEMFNKIKSKLKENESASDYIRKLIEKDLA